MQSCPPKCALPPSSISLDFLFAPLRPSVRDSRLRPGHFLPAGPQSLPPVQSLAHKQLGFPAGNSSPPPAAVHPAAGPLFLSRCSVNSRVENSRSISADLSTSTAPQCRGAPVASHSR